MRGPFFFPFLPKKITFILNTAQKSDSMEFVKKMAGYWFSLICSGLVLYFCLANLDSIYVRIPHIGEFNSSAALVFFLVFMAGAMFSGTWFGIDAIKKALRIRSLEKRLKQVQKQLAEKDLYAATQSTSLTHDISRI